MIDGHITDEQALAFIDGALSEVERTRAAHHARGCVQCAARIRDAEQLDTAFRAAVDVIDAREPRHWARDTQRRMIPAASAGASRRRGPNQSRVSLGHLRWAAVALFCVAGLASATLWRTANSSNPRGAAKSAPAAAPSLNRTGVVIPAGDSIIVIIDGAGVGSLVKVVRDAQRHDGSYVEVSGASAPAFRSDGGVLELTLGGRVAEVHVTVPAGLRFGRVDANGRYIVRLDGDRVEPPSAGDIGIRVTW